MGRPLIDLLRKARLGCRLMPVSITGGDGETAAAGYYRVPKRDLIIGLQVLLQVGGLQIAGGAKVLRGAGERDGGDAGEGDADGA